MIGFKMTSTTFNQALAVTKAAPVAGDFVWDGQDEDERSLSKDEMLAGLPLHANGAGGQRAAAPKNK